jgi:hypothetical protein
MGMGRLGMSHLLNFYVWSRKELKRIFDEIDQDGNGDIDWDEFMDAMKMFEELIKENIKNAVQSYFNEQQRINTPITRAGIIAAMHREGVNNVYLTKPETDLGSGFNKNSEKDLKDALMDYFNSQEKKNEPVTTDGLIEAVKNLDININTGICYFCQFSCEFAENTHNELIISLKTDVDALASTLKGTLNSDLGEKCVRGEDESDADFFLRVNDLNLSRYANQ